MPGIGKTCALVAGGLAKCWGEGGSLGDGTTNGSKIPVDVAYGLSYSFLSNGAAACGVTPAGGVKCWGYNSNGQVGNGTTIKALAPVDVFGLGSGVAMTAASLTVSCALTTVGGVKCWGDNADGALGNGTFVDSHVPVDVVGLSSGVAMVAAASTHTCALLTAGTVKCWGWNITGGLGDGTMNGSPVPVDVVGLDPGVTSIGAGFGHSCALTAQGGVKCWGLNSQGELGDGTGVNSSTPVGVSGLNSGVVQLSVGDGHACALLSTGGVTCWGDNDYGQLGNGKKAISGEKAPVPVVGLSAGVVAVAAGYGTTCAIVTGGGLLCWGENSVGEIGDGTQIHRTVPAKVVGFW
jgi:alpha-tubulin suppressor-like RCC1 family protein